MNIKNFVKNLIGGGAIGIAMIIPGVSGGTVAVLLNMYDQLIGAVGNIRKNFKGSLALLLPVLLGAVLAFGAAYFPLSWALERAPLPTVMLFAGLMVGSLPKLFSGSKAYSFKKLNTVSILLPFLAVIAICIAKLHISAGEVSLNSGMPVWGYFAIIGVAMLTSCALVIPGVSGSMLLIILGYYNSILGLIGSITSNFGHAALVLGLFALGILIGFFSIAKLMKYLLTKFPRGTHWAIIGFVLGSIPAIFIVFDYAGAPMDGIQIAASVILCLFGIIATYILTSYAESKLKGAEK